MLRHPALTLLLPLAFLAGCATPANHYDPLEPVNRGIYSFNTTVDDAIVQPVAKTYVNVTPRPVRQAVSNFFGNIDDAYIGVSNLLEGKWRDASMDLARLTINSVLGLGGLLDIATPVGLPKHNSDFGQVLGSWGIGSGPYLVVPLMGSKTLRDTSDYVGAYLMNPLHDLSSQSAENSLASLNLLDERSRLLAAEAVVAEASFGDRYSFVRDSYLRRRHSLIWDGRPPKPLQLGVDDDMDAPIAK